MSIATEIAPADRLLTAAEFHRLADLRTEILADTGVFIEARPFRAGAYRERTPLMHEIRREGIDF